MNLRIVTNGATVVGTLFLVIAALMWSGCSSSDRVTAPTTVPPDTTASPPPSAGHSLVYAAHAGMVVLINAGLGGAATPGASTPTRVWGWTGTEWRLLDSSGPPIRNLAGVTYDTRRQTLVMHGGSHDLGRTYGDTWEWSAGWRQVGGDGPGARDHTQLAFDSVRGRAVLFGGSSNPATLAADTWEFDGTQWSRVATIGPPPRVHHAMQFDPVTREVILHGGNGADGVTLSDTWGWDGSRWTLRGAGPARSHARMAFDGGFNALVLAGSIAPGVGIDMLVRRGSTWTSGAGAVQPPSRYLTDLAYDARRNVMVLFGGGVPGGGATLYDDTWEHDGSTWRRAR